MSPGRASPRRRRDRAAAAPPEGPPDADPERAERQAWQQALRLLARREMSEAQVHAALDRRGHPAAAVEAVLRRLRERSYLDDAGLAARFARSRLAHHGQGRNRVRQALRSRGVSRAIIEDGLATALTEVSEADSLDALARRYWTQRKREPPARRLRALWAFLLRRGFPAALVQERLRALWPRWSDVLEDLEPGEE